jgi:hypothetical protein
MALARAGGGLTVAHGCTVAGEHLRQPGHGRTDRRWLRCRGRSGERDLQIGLRSFAQRSWHGCRRAVGKEQAMGGCSPVSGRVSPRAAGPLPKTLHACARRRSRRAALTGCEPLRAAAAGLSTANRTAASAASASI